MTELCIFRFGPGATEDDFRQVFPNASRVKVLERISFVTFETPEEAQEALDGNNGATINGGEINIEFSRQSGGNRGGRRGRGEFVQSGGYGRGGYGGGYGQGGYGGQWNNGSGFGGGYGNYNGNGGGFRDEFELVVTNLSDTTSDATLYDYFPGAFRIKVMGNGKAFVKFNEQHEADTGLQVDGKTIDGSQVEVAYSRQSGGYGGGNQYGGGGNLYRDSYELVVTNLDESITEDVLQGYFPKAFKVKVMNNGKAFIKFNEQHEADEGLSVNGKTINGAEVEVQQSRQSGGRGGGRGGRGFGDRGGFQRGRGGGNRSYGQTYGY